MNTLASIFFALIAILASLVFVLLTLCTFGSSMGSEEDRRPRVSGEAKLCRPSLGPKPSTVSSSSWALKSRSALSPGSRSRLAPFQSRGSLCFPSFFPRRPAPS
jgi:hypothetical protein